MDTLTVSAAASTTANYSADVQYVNQEIDAGDLSLRPKSRLYVVITPAGADVKPFHIGYSIANGLV
jgi:hypothetical protein